MSDIFSGLRSGIQFPQVVMNQGPLPGSGGLPQPLHESPDARINYGSSLLGDLTPYAYGEPGYLSSQNAYLNIPHKIQKIVPKVFLPEAKVGARDFFDLSHPIDDGDLAFVLRLDRSSLFCTGLRNGDMRRAGLGTAVDPFINLCTLNYILSGLQLGVTGSTGDLWNELFYNLDKRRFGKGAGLGSRDYMEHPMGLDDVIHVVRHCVRPFGIARGSEKQGGQDESTLAAATWPVSFVISLTIDGKESNVLNIWHYHDLHAGNDLVLRLKLMPLRPYTLNHYYKGVKRQTWDLPSIPGQPHGTRYVWQLVPDLFHLDCPTAEEERAQEQICANLPVHAQLNDDGEEYKPLLRIKLKADNGNVPLRAEKPLPPHFAWQELGYWHIGRSQIMTGKYGHEEYWHNDLANTLRTNHLDITLQPTYVSLPIGNQRAGTGKYFVARLGGKSGIGKPSLAAKALQGWTAQLALEKITSGPSRFSAGSDRASKRLATMAPSGRPGTSGGQAIELDNDAATMIPVPSLSSRLDPAPSQELGLLTGADKAVAPAEPEWLSATSIDKPSTGSSSLSVSEPDWMGSLDYTEDPPTSSTSGSASVASASTAGAGKKTGGGGGTGKAAAGGAKRGRSIGGGSLLKADGTSEPSMVGML